MFWSIALGSLIGALASGAVSYLLSQATQPKIPSPPQPAGYEGPEGRQVWNPEKNQYEWIPSEESLRKKQEEEARNAKIRELEEKLNVTEPERVAEWDKAANAYVERMMAPLSEQYEKARRNLMEDFNRRGLGNSKAMVDALAQLEKSWMETKADVQNRAIAIREDLAQRDLENKLNVIQSLRQGSSLSEAERIRQQGIAAQQSAAASAINEANWRNHMNSTLAQWASGMQAFQGGLQAGSNLALLYGLTSGGGGTTADKSAAYSRAGQLSNIYSAGISTGSPYNYWWQYPGLFGRYGGINYAR